MRFARVAVSVTGVVLGLLLAPGQLVAHHSFAAEFDVSQPMTLRGKIMKIEWINPHAWMHLAVTRPDGVVEEWEVELGPPNALLRRGWDKNSVPVGTEAVIFGYRSKDPNKTRINGRDANFPDGRKLFIGSSGTGAPEFDKR